MQMQTQKQVEGYEGERGERRERAGGLESEDVSEGGLGFMSTNSVCASELMAIWLEHGVGG